MATKDLTVNWNKPTIDTDHPKPDTYTLQGRKTGTQAWKTLADKVPHKDTDPQTVKVLKAKVDSEIPGLVPGDTIDLQVRGVNTGGAGPWSTTGTSPGVPGNPPGAPSAPTATWG